MRLFSVRADENLYYCCWILGRVAYATNNTFCDVVNDVSNDYLRMLYSAADVFHCENPDKMVNEIIEENGIENGNFIRDEESPKSTPLSKVYIRLVYRLFIEKFYGDDKDALDVLRLVVNHPIGKLIEDYRNCLYWQSPECIYCCYVDNSLDAMDY